MSESKPIRSLSIDNINPHVIQAKYAVRGELAVKSEQYRLQIAKHEKLPFDQVISANIGNPQQLDQKPITYFRQVLSLLEYPPLLEKEDVLVQQLGYKKDVITRAKALLGDAQSVGAYSQSQGLLSVRKSVASFIESQYIYISDG
jgi:alanine transaminase